MFYTNTRSPVKRGLFLLRSEEAAEPAAVDGEGAAGDVAGALRDEEGGERRELLRLGESAERNLGLQARLDLCGVDSLASRVGLVQLRYPLGVRVAGEDRVHGDPVPRHLAGQGGREAGDRRPQAVREHEVLDRLLRRDRRYGEDPPPAPGLHLRERARGELDRALEQERRRLVPVRRAERLVRPRRGAAAVRDEHVEAPEALETRLHH